MVDPSRSGTQNNFYSILGIPKSASLLDISKAYKSLVRKWHPDKNSSNKAEAVDKFRAINEAYRALSIKKREEQEKRVPDEPTTPTSTPPDPVLLPRNASRRSTTPMTPRTPKTPMTSNSPIAGIFQPTLSKVTSQRSTSTPIIFSQSMVRRKPQALEKKLDCTLEELCHGAVKKIKITRDAISNTGLIVQEEEILKIKIKPGWKTGTKITFEGKGDERPGTLPADIIFKINEKRHPIFKREGDDLELGVEVPLLKALTGCIITIPLLGGEKMTMTFEEIIYPGYEKIVPGQGMPKSKEQGRRGDLRLKFLVNFPIDLSDEQRTDVLSILNDSS